MFIEVVKATMPRPECRPPDAAYPRRSPSGRSCPQIASVLPALATAARGRRPAAAVEMLTRLVDDGHDRQQSVRTLEFDGGLR